MAELRRPDDTGADQLARPVPGRRKYFRIFSQSCAPSGCLQTLQCSRRPKDWDSAFIRTPKADKEQTWRDTGETIIDNLAGVEERFGPKAEKLGMSTSCPLYPQNILALDLCYEVAASMIETFPPEP